MKNLFLILCSMLIVGCDAKKSSDEAVITKPLQFREIEFSDITPMLDGSAYAKSDDSRLWYLHGLHAQQMALISESPMQTPEFFEVTPLADGGAYATTLNHAGIWHLQAGVAERVSEGMSVSSTDKPRKLTTPAFYALYVAEHKKRKQAESQAEDSADKQDASRQEDDY